MAKVVGWIFREMGASKHVLSYMLFLLQGLIPVDDETLNQDVKFTFPLLETEWIFVNTNRMWQT